MKHIFSFLFLFCFIACTSDNEHDYFLELDCDTDYIYYNADDNSRSISAIVSNKCLGCHSEANMSQGDWIVLETYEQLIDISNYSLYDVTLGPSASMPKEGNPQLTECEKLQIESWINNGYPYDETGR